MSLGKNLLLAVLSTTLCFGALEGASCVIRPTALPEPVEGGGPVRLVPDYELFFRMPRSQAAHLPLPTTNSLGLRGPEPGNKALDVFRILSLGESTTFGWRLGYRQTYSFLLEEKLGRVHGRRVQVVNAGVPAYTSFQGLLFLQSRGPELRPDAVLVYFGANDFTPISFRTNRSGAPSDGGALTDRELHARRQSPLVRVADLLLRHSNLFRIAVLDGPTHGGWERSTGSRVPAEDRRWVLERMRAWCRARGVRLVLVIPWYREFRMHAPLLREFASRSDVVVIDLPEKLLALPHPIEDYFMDAIHPNARGHQVIAHAIAEVLAPQWGARSQTAQHPDAPPER